MQIKSRKEQPAQIVLGLSSVAAQLERAMGSVRGQEARGTARTAAASAVIVAPLQPPPVAAAARSGEFQ